MTECVFPGSFDPVTRGHMDLIRRAAGLFDRVTVTVMINIHKQGTFSPDERIRLLEKACREFSNVRVDRWDGLLSAYMKEKGVRCVIRGARSSAEFEAETGAAAVNRMLNPEMETLLLSASEEYSGLSSSAVREIAAFGGDIRPFVPEVIAQEIAMALANR